MPLAKFDPPAFLNDLPAAQLTGWSDLISGFFDAAREGDSVNLEFDGPRHQFFNPTRVDFAADETELDIAWTAFPRNVKVTSVSDRIRWQRADASRDLQDEYCEWSVNRDAATGKVTRVTFTCEGPEYWQYLASQSRDVVLGLYREFISPAVQTGDLFDSSGRYVARNKWNNSTTNGAMHLIQRNNTLSAEIELAGGASVVRKISGRILTEERELIDCGLYGGRERHSDPHIGAMVNSLTRQKADVTLQNPVGLYFNDLLTNGWTTPDGSNAKDYWKYIRGNNGKHVRAVYEVPTSKGFVVGDIKINGRRIEFGAQIADFISIKLTGVAHRIGQSTEQPLTGCRRERDTGLESVSAPSALRGRVSNLQSIQNSTEAAASPVQSLAELAEERFEELAVLQQLPVELAIPKIQYEIAETWADAALEGNLESLLDSQRVSEKPKVISPVDDWRAGGVKHLARGFFLMLDGNEIKDIPTLKCILGKFPKGHIPTEEELRKAFRECAGRS